MKPKRIVAMVLVILLLGVSLVSARAGIALEGPEQVTTCNSCDDCSTKLASGLYDWVVLTTDIVDWPGTCVSLLFGESDLTFDCAGHLIDGDDIAIDPDHGVAFFHGTNNVIRDCRISDFSHGVYLWDATNHLVEDTVSFSNGAGIYLGYTTSSSLQRNETRDNGTGIHLEYSSDSNLLLLNTACENTVNDIWLEGGSGNDGSNNRCDIANGWNDQGTTGCRFACGTWLVYVPGVLKNQ
jgi:parallel beta-helix repeat protein